MKLLATMVLWLALVSAAEAACTFTFVQGPDGRVISCSTCCVGSTCSTVCN